MKTLLTIAKVDVIQNDDGSLEWTAGMAVDNDGSGGNPENDPCHQPDTSLHHDGKALNAQTVPFIVVPPSIIAAVPGIVLGCKAVVTFNGKSVDAVVGDIGPPRKIGEASVSCAKALRINPSPNRGGLDAKAVGYQIWPGVPAVVNGVSFQLQKPLLFFRG